MARRRLNTRFLIILSIPLVLLIGGLAAWKVLPKWFPQIKWIVRGTPAQHAAEAKALFDQGNFKDAGEKYKRALQLKGSPDAEMYTLLGDCYARLVLEDIENLRYAKGCWDQAHSIDTNYLPALKRLLDLYVADAEVNRTTRSAQQWDTVQEYARKVLAIDPKDSDARLAMGRAVLRRWMAGVETNQQRVDEAIADLQALAKGPPLDARVTFDVWQARMWRGAELVRQNDRAGATALFSELLKEVDAALSENPTDANLHYRASLALSAIGSFERSPGQPPKYQDRVRDVVHKALELVKPEDPDYVEINLTAAKQLEQAGDIAGAEKIQRQLIERRPADLIPRIMLSELIGRDPKRRQEAIDLLDNAPAPDPNEVYGIEVFRHKRMQMEALANKINLKLDATGDAKDQAEYDALVKEAEQSYARLLEGIGESPGALQIRGRIELAKGENIQAVQTLDKALNLMSAPTNLPQLEQRYKLMYMLARANILVEQTAKAEQLLRDVVANFEKFAPARLSLAQLLLRRKAFDEARPHLDTLYKALPDSPIVIRLIMSTLEPQKDAEKLAELYAKLPESNPQEQIEKAQMAMFCKRRDEAVRLMELAAAARPDRVELVIYLARLYNELGNRDRAMQMIDEAQARQPQLSALKIVRAELAGAAEPEVTELRRDLVEQIADPFTRAITFYELEMQEGNPNEAYAHLQEAARLKPDDGRVLGMLFQFAIYSGDLAKAESYVETLSRLNQDNAGGRLYRIQIAKARGDLNTAADLASQLTQTMPEFAQSWVVYGQVQLAQQKYSQAADSFSAALTRQAQNLDAMLGRITAAYATNQPTLARRYIEDARKIFPRNSRLRELDIQHELTQKDGDPQKAIAPREEDLKLAIERKSPSEIRAWLALGQTYMAVARRQGSPQQARPFLEKARETLTKAVAKFPDDLALTDELADTLVQLRNHAEAEKAIFALRDRPAWKDRPEPTLLLAAYYNITGKPAEQEKTLRGLLEKNPTQVQVQVLLSSLLAKQNKLDDALQVLSPNMDDPTIRRQRIELQIRGGRLADAEREITTALASTPNPSPSLLVRQAYVYQHSGRMTEALSVLDRVLQAEPNNQEAMYVRANIYVLARRNLDRAIQDLTALRDQGMGIEVRRHLAQAHYLKGDEEAAISELEAALRVQPEDVDSRAFLVRLYSNTKPPRWTQVDRIFREAAEIPELASNVPLLHEQAKTWLVRKDTDKAQELILQARKAAPENMDLLQTQLAILHEARQFRPLLQMTEQAAQSKKAPYWVYQYRGKAKKALDDKQGAMDEFSTALDITAASQNDSATTVIITTIAEEIGIPPAKNRIIQRAERGEARYRLMMAYLLQAEGDIPGAVGWVERVLSDESQPPAMIASARRMIGGLYTQLDPPDVSKAVEIYKKILETEPNDVAVLNNLACAMILPNSGYTAKDALAYSQQAISILDRMGITEPYISDTHGYVLVLNGRHEEGILLLQQAIDRKPDFIDAYYHLGEAYLSMPRPMVVEAEAALSQALSLLEDAGRNGAKVDATLKPRIEKALERCRQPVPA